MFLLVPAYPGSPEQKAVKRLCVCVWLQKLRIIAIYRLKIYSTGIPRVCLQCFDAVGWAAGRASGL